MIVGYTAVLASPAFLYLNDVTTSQGPLRFIPGSHLPNPELAYQIYCVGRSGLDVAYYDDATNRKCDEVGVPIA